MKQTKELMCLYVLSVATKKKIIKLNRIKRNEFVWWAKYVGKCVRNDKTQNEKCPDRFFFCFHALGK